MKNRIIKFRAWDVKKSRMIYFNACKRWGFINHELEPETTASFGGSEVQLTTNPDHYILMQFTGLLDKNGVEIYEGDVLNVRSISVGDYIATVKFVNGAFVVSDSEHITTALCIPLRLEIISTAPPRQAQSSNQSTGII